MHALPRTRLTAGAVLLPYRSQTPTPLPPPPSPPLLHRHAHHRLHCTPSALAATVSTASPPPSPPPSPPLHAQCSLCRTPRETAVSEIPDGAAIAQSDHGGVAVAPRVSVRVPAPAEALSVDISSCAHRECLRSQLLLFSNCSGSRPRTIGVARAHALTEAGAVVQSMPHWTAKPAAPQIITVASAHAARTRAGVTLLPSCAHTAVTTTGRTVFVIQVRT